MSHFTVLVIGDNVDEQLAPFQENNMGDCPREFMEFNDTEAEMLEEYATEGAERVVMPDGSLKLPWDDMFKVEGANAFESRIVVPDHLERREIPYKELYATFDDFVTEYHGYSGRDESTGRYGYWENPNAKWDWYQVGGRWTGMFKLKSGAAGEVGRPGLMTARAEAGYVDSCRLGDIDIDGMRNEAEAKAAARYDRFHAILAGRPFPIFKDMATQYPTVDEARQAYWGTPAVKDITATREFGPFDLEDYVETSREAYLQRARDNAFSTFAVLKDGQWYEKGSMGWWGMVSDEKDGNAWSQQFASLLDSLPPETLLTVVDCHI